ncbi:uncharacterized protein LOC114370666 isoform X4 [Glycine soja]|uniref:uncharacterized protein LOC114370666 isoform X4 n=1 Tax=Glycine soja TaxID=3848 RepID=UPI00071925E1|nr:uncharacterized protein LOC114370666 isoform X4 [Glycine soja]
MRQPAVARRKRIDRGGEIEAFRKGGGSDFRDSSIVFAMRLQQRFGTNLKLNNLKIRDTFQHKVVLSTPNLSSLTVCIFGASSLSIQPLSSTCNLSCLEEGTIDIATDISHPVLIGWLQVFTNVKILTLSYETLKLILKDLSNLATMGSQPLCFVRLESLKFVTNRFRVISDEEVNKAVEYLLQNSPLIRVLLSKKLYHGSLLNYLGPVLAGLANHNRSQIGPSLEWDHNHQHHKGGL